MVVDPLQRKPVPQGDRKHHSRPAPVFKVIRQGDAKYRKGKTAPEQGQSTLPGFYVHQAEEGPDRHVVFSIHVFFQFVIVARPVLRDGLPA